MTVLLGEIGEQPSALAGLLEDGWWNVVHAAERIRAFSPTCVMIAARGTSDNAARYAKYLLGAHNRLPVALAVPSLFTLYHSPPRLARALVIGISQSGQSPDVVEVIAEARRQGAVTLAITNHTASPLAVAADHVIALCTGDEQSVAATKTYTAELMSVAMLSAALARESGQWGALGFVADAMSRALDGAATACEGAAAFAHAGRFVVVGRGFNYCTAHELALKMKETSYVLAEPYSPADLMHGPVAMVDRGFPVVLIAPSGPTLGSTMELAGLLEREGARLVVFSDRSELLRRAEVAIELPDGVPEWLSPIVAIGPGQLWAHALAVAKGLDPDQPRGLNKVTLTR